ncbi:MAG: hypothetical protein EZS28_007906 [Streblomastix strix]|uniref:Uncharacterized protein n=1 Tax=Streblomastix strix TaxID=222440 RepID=A0A5J4WNN8_9EUKA|nr:MAG: hypothetical protein EZS28_007906 [Streblomastix strix]
MILAWIIDANSEWFLTVPSVPSVPSKVVLQLYSSTLNELATSQPLPIVQPTGPSAPSIGFANGFMNDSGFSDNAQFDADSLIPVVTYDTDSVILSPQTINYGSEPLDAMKLYYSSYELKSGFITTFRTDGKNYTFELSMIVLRVAQDNIL